MTALNFSFDKFDQAIANVLHCYGRFLLRISIGIIFVWFGALKRRGQTLMGIDPFTKWGMTLLPFTFTFSLLRKQN